MGRAVSGRQRKRKSGKTRKGNKLLRTTLITCAHSATNNKRSYFYEQFKRVSVHRSSKCAYVAVAYSLLISIYHILNDGVEFKDLGADYYNQFNKECKINGKRLKRWRSEIIALTCYTCVHSITKGVVA